MLSWITWRQSTRKAIRQLNYMQIYLIFFQYFWLHEDYEPVEKPKMDVLFSWGHGSSEVDEEIMMM